MEGELSERHFPEARDSIQGSRTAQASRKELCITHMEYDHDGSHL